MDKTDDIILKPFESVVEAMFRLAGASMGESTRRAYASDWRSFEQWCKLRQFRALPADALTVCLYVADVQEKLVYGSIRRALTAIGRVHELQGQTSPTKADSVKRVLLGLAKTKGRAVDKATPISFAELRAMMGACPGSAAGIRDRAILALGWGGALRRSEVVGLDIINVVFRAEGVALHVQRAKNDPTGKGRDLGIPRSKTGFCLVQPIENWAGRLSRSIQGADDGSFFRFFGSAGRGFFPPVGARLGARSVCSIVKKYARLVGLDGVYSGHSLRRGLATEAARCGVPEWALQQHTGHSSPDQLRGYIHAGRLFVDSPINAILAGARDSF